MVTREDLTRDHPVRRPLGVVLSLSMALLLLGVVLAVSARGSPATTMDQQNSIGVWVTEDVDRGLFVSLALAPSRPHTACASYSHFPRRSLNYACLTPNGWVTETVDGGTEVDWTSLVLEPVSPYTPHIAYVANPADHDLKHAWWTPGGWRNETVDSVGEVGAYASLALAPSAPYTPHVAYLDQTNSAVKHAWRTPDGWMSETVSGEPMYGWYASLALAPASPYTPQIAYVGGRNLFHMVYAWRTAGGWFTETVDEQAHSGRFASLALAPGAPYTPHISYLGGAYEDLKYAWRGPAGWEIDVLDSEGDVGWYTALALAPTSPYTRHIVYWDQSNEVLKHAWGAQAGWRRERISGADLHGFLWQPSLALETTAPYTPHVAYQDSEFDLHHAWRVPGHTIFLPLTLRSYP